MANSSGEEEEEEYEYEEIEVEEEEEEDEYEEIEVEEEVEPEEEDEPEEDEPEEEVEPEEEEEEPEEDEEEEEEEYEEVEVTDDEIEVEEDTAAAVVTAEEDATLTAVVTVEAEDESVCGLSDLVIPSVDQSNYDVRQDQQPKGNEGCLKSEHQDTVISEVVAPLDSPTVEAVGSMLGTKSSIQQNRNGKEVRSVDVGNSSLQDTVNSKVATPCDMHAVKTIGSMLGSKSPSQQYKKNEELLSVDNGSSTLPERLKSAAHPFKLGDNTVEREQSLVEKSTVPVPITAAGTSEKHFSAPNGSHDNIITTDIDQTRVRSQKEDLHFLSSENKDHKASRCYTPQMTAHIDDTRIPSQKEDLNLPSIEKMEQMAPRHYTPQMRPRSLSPGAECEVVNKRSAMVCEYFLKGWCIKGSSCRFLHKRDQISYARGQVDGDMLSAKAEICSGSGDAGDAAGSSKPLAHSRPKYFMTNSDDVLPNSTGGRYSETDYREHVNGKDSFRLHERDLLYPHLSISAQRSSSKEGSRVFSSQNEEEMDMFKEGRSSDHIDHHGSSFSLSRSTLLDNLTHGGTSDTQMNYSVDSYAMLEESVAMRRQYTLDLHSSPIRDNGSVRSTFSPDNSSWKDMLTSYKNERKFIPYNWEPSLPFRPSHYITSFTTPASGVQYDPLRDSIEQTDIRRGSFRHSYGQTQNMSFRNSLESHKRLHSVHSDSNEKDNYIPDKDTRVVEGLEAESAAISATGAGNPVGVSVKDVLKATKSSSEGNSKLKTDDLRRNGEMGKQINEVDDEETKVIKVFRAALIEYVKELMKPVWHEGRLSKDVYKVIVQKAEDKILSTLPSNEVPNTPETIKQFLSSSRPNILKLIQAYVDKYGRF